MDTLSKAKQLRSIYVPGYEFPEWVVYEPIWKTHKWNKTNVFYHYYDDLNEVRELVRQREPCNIAFNRIYNQEKLKTEFGWAFGAYKQGSPNIAILCDATVKTLKRGFINVKVINLIGCALDNYKQPDSIHYDTLEKVQSFYRNMWKLALSASIQSQCKFFKVYNVGGGVFAGEYQNVFIQQIFEQAFKPLLPEFQRHGIIVLGYDFNKKEFNGGFIPRILDDENEDYKNTLYANAWDPWTIIGNGNESDRSLDGCWGRCSNMSVLGWSVTNPDIQYVSV